MNTTKQPFKAKTTYVNIEKILFFITGLLFSQFIFLNIIYTQHPKGGWVTLIGNIPTSTLRISILFLLVSCLVALWRFSSTTTKSHQKDKSLKVVALH